MSQRHADPDHGQGRYRQTKANDGAPGIDGVTSRPLGVSSALAEVVSLHMFPENIATPCVAAPSGMDSSGTFEATLKFFDLLWLEQVERELSIAG